MYLNLRIATLFFLTIPVIEIYLFVKIGGLIGVLPTVILLVTAAMLGVAMLRRQGLSTFRRLREALSRQETPTQEFVEGLVLMIGGALFLIPGFFTDILGLYLLIPFTRRRFVKYLLDYQFNIRNLHAGTNVRHPNSNQGVTIEGDFKRED